MMETKASCEIDGRRVEGKERSRGRERWILLNDTLSKSDAIRYYVVKPKRKFNCTNEVGKVSFGLWIHFRVVFLSLVFHCSQMKCHSFDTVTVHISMQQNKSTVRLLSLWLGKSLPVTFTKCITTQTVIFLLPA